MTTRLSPTFKEALATEITRLMISSRPQGVGRDREGVDRALMAAKDLQASRQGLITARRKLGGAQIALEQWARESGDRTVRGLAAQVAKAVKELDKISPILEKVHVQVNRLK